MSSADKLYALANELFVSEDYEAALKKYTEAIQKDDGETSNANYYIARSYCHFKLDNFTGAMSDAKKAIDLDPKNPKAYLRKGMAAFSLAEYESAKEAFQKAQQIDPSPQYKTWIRKCDAELEFDEKGDDGESSDDINLTSLPSKPKPQPDGPPPLEPDLPSSIPASTSTSTTTTTTTTTTSSNTPAVQTTQTQPPQNKIRYEWYETESHATVSVLIKNVKKEEAKIDLQNNSFSIEVKLPTGSEYQLHIDLADSIIPSESNISFLSTKIEMKLKKSRPAKWNNLENTGTNTVKSWDIVSDPKKEKGLTYPSSSKHGAKDWDALTRGEPDEKLEGDAALNKVFADIYKGASDDQRRAMLKSYQESGGTVLSTNWDEVGKSEVKGHPPKGMDMKLWKDLHG
eukprot:TRINITY_DN10267_c0_g1_i1.p1 TRINITY_DN10267_c0_g1~~TRINITY_DN10267_c0_g1_i1.p1  ORF type:complete len:400 (-),score=99.90 TRINITY_DN10267_c0_g1_i1:76-1275(-)